MKSVMNKISNLPGIDAGMFLVFSAGLICGMMFNLICGIVFFSVPGILGGLISAFLIMWFNQEN